MSHIQKRMEELRESEPFYPPDRWNLGVDGVEQEAGGRNGEQTPCLGESTGTSTISYWKTRQNGPRKRPDATLYWPTSPSATFTSIAPPLADRYDRRRVKSSRVSDCRPL